MKNLVNVKEFIEWTLSADSDSVIKSYLDEAVKLMSLAIALPGMKAGLLLALVRGEATYDVDETNGCIDIRMKK